MHYRLDNTNPSMSHVLIVLYPDNTQSLVSTHHDKTNRYEYIPKYQNDRNLPLHLYLDEYWFDHLSDYQ